MRKNLRFTLLCDESDRQLIALVAQHLSRSQADAIRIIIRSAAQEIGGNNNSQSLSIKQENTKPTRSFMHNLSSSTEEEQ